MSGIQHRIFMAFDGLSHFTALAGGELLSEAEGIETRAGPAVLWLKLWAEDIEHAAELVIALCNRLEFRLDGPLELVSTRPIRTGHKGAEVYDVRVLACRRG